ncbi:MAG: hypothetical protein DMF59_13700 [Acidobacteria bacterium]|nr:MAG: hypothetical protein DMF59_13700 [Acidobacteriota bacterium]
MEEITPVVAPDSQPPTPPPSLPFRRPADYYSSPVGEARPLFPRWVPFGCGSAAIVALIAVFSLGILASQGKLGELFDIAFWLPMQGEIDKMFTKDVKPADKATFDAEMKTMRESVRLNRMPMQRLQPLLQMLREVVSDERVTPPETARLIEQLRQINKK